MRVALYARVSTGRQLQNDLSVPDQLRSMHEWAAGHGYRVVREYVEAGTATSDDKRPEFNRMMDESRVKPRPFDVVVVHSQSRFYRDLLGFLAHEHELEKKGVTLFAITQDFGEGENAKFMRQMTSLFDAHSSRENAKHTHRAMCQNARMGFFSASQAPYGYMTVTTDVSGARGRKKKKLAINEDEAAVVRDIYRWYLSGRDGRTMGMKEIVKHLTDLGITMRGRPWRIQKMQDILSSRAYVGEHYFNVKNSKTGEIRPASEWISVKSEAIIDAETFERVSELREIRSPRKTPPRVVGNPTLLTGIVKCECGAAMTLATGKSGNYRYYKCSARMAKGGTNCHSRNLPAETFDRKILDTMADRLLAPERMNAILVEMRKTVRESREDQQARINALSRQKQTAEAGLNRLYEAIEKGIIPLDDLLQKRLESLKTSREALQLEITRLYQSMAAPVEQVLPSMVERFCKGVRKKLDDPAFAKRYLQLLVEDIIVTDSQATIRGNKAKLAAAIRAHKEKLGTDLVPSFTRIWRARDDSNLRSLAQSTGASRSSLATIGFIQYLQGFRQASGEI